MNAAARSYTFFFNWELSLLSILLQLRVVEIHIFKILFYLKCNPAGPCHKLQRTVSELECFLKV